MSDVFAIVWSEFVTKRFLIVDGRRQKFFIHLQTHRNLVEKWSLGAIFLLRNHWMFFSASGEKRNESRRFLDFSLKISGEIGTGIT